MQGRSSRSSAQGSSQLGRRELLVLAVAQGSSQQGRCSSTRQQGATEAEGSGARRGPRRPGRAWKAGGSCCGMSPHSSDEGAGGLPGKAGRRAAAAVAVAPPAPAPWVAAAAAGGSTRERPGSGARSRGNPGGSSARSRGREGRGGEGREGRKGWLRRPAISPAAAAEGGERNLGY